MGEQKYKPATQTTETGRSLTASSSSRASRLLSSTTSSFVSELMEIMFNAILLVKWTTHGLFTSCPNWKHFDLPQYSTLSIAILVCFLEDILFYIEAGVGFLAGFLRCSSVFGQQKLLPLSLSAEFRVSSLPIYSWWQNIIPFREALFSIITEPSCLHVSVLCSNQRKPKLRHIDRPR